MALGRPLTPLELTESDREQLGLMARSRSLPHGLVRRAEIVLLAAQGWPNEAVAAAVAVASVVAGAATPGSLPKTVCASSSAKHPSANIEWL